MNPYNPYQAPQQMNEAPPGANDNAQAVILEAMKRTRPWVMFLAILGFLSAGLLVVLGLFMVVAGSAVAALGKGTMPFGPAIGLFYVALGGIYVAPSVLLWRYASSITQMSLSGGSIDSLATAVKAQASFWRFVGIMMAVLIGINVVLFFGLVIVGIIAAASR